MPARRAGRVEAGAFAIMPLFANAVDLIRANLERISRDGRVRAVDIGHFTKEQHEAINRVKASAGMPPPGSPVIVFIGSHLYTRRNRTPAQTAKPSPRFRMSA